jgi:hypothetical protein
MGHDMGKERKIMEFKLIFIYYFLLLFNLVFYIDFVYFLFFILVRISEGRVIWV